MSPPSSEAVDPQPSDTANEPKEEVKKPDIYSDDIEQDKELKKKVIIDVLTSHCSDSSEFEDFRLVANALKGGDKLSAKVISGGVTNYSYKIFLENDPDNGPSFFAKVAFPYALWNPDRSVHYDIARTANEYKLMKRFKEMMGDDAPVATPYICQDVEDMKILIVEWASTDEQWANQFIEGEVDHRVIPKLAQALATLNLAPFDDEFDPMFNDNVRPCMRSIFGVSKALFGQHIDSEETFDACVAYLKEMGQERFDEIIEGLDKLYMTRECINHSDSQCFNLLVESKPSIDKLQAFGEKGDLAICDWEMAMAGPHGRDAGIFQAWPIACALTHAAYGRKDVAYDLLSCCTEFWDAYAKIFAEEGGKDEDFMKKTFRSSMGWNAKYLFIAFYQLGLLIDNLPTEGLSEEMTVGAKGSIGLTGIKFMEYAFGGKDPDLSLDELRAQFHDIVQQEIESLLDKASKYKPRPRRASVLRETGRRVSDALLMDEVTRSFSINSATGRPSIYDDPAIREALKDLEE